MTELSPAAQAMLDAYEGANMSAGLDGADRGGIAAVLRALADQVVPEEPYYENCDVVREEILDIAAELDPTAHS